MDTEFTKPSAGRHFLNLFSLTLISLPSHNPYSSYTQFLSAIQIGQSLSIILLSAWLIISNPSNLFINVSPSRRHSPAVYTLLNLSLIPSLTLITFYCSNMFHCSPSHKAESLATPGPCLPQGSQLWARHAAGPEQELAEEEFPADRWQVLKFLFVHLRIWASLLGNTCNLVCHPFKIIIGLWSSPLSELIKLYYLGALLYSKIVTYCCVFFFF